MTLGIVCEIRNTGELRKFLKEVYKPSSRMYREFLTPAQFADRFGPSQKEFDQLQQFTKRHNFRILDGSREAMYLRVTGAVRDVESAFAIEMHQYKRPADGSLFRSPDREPTTPEPLFVSYIDGLQNYSVPRPAIYVVPKPTKNGTGSAQFGMYFGSDLRAAYYGGPLTGTGQRIALIEVGAFNLADVTASFKLAGQINKVPIQPWDLRGNQSAPLADCKTCRDDEHIADIVQAASMASGAAQIDVLVGDSMVMPIVIATSLAYGADSQVSSSWLTTSGEENSIIDHWIDRLAVQGQTFVQASGDKGAYFHGMTYIYPLGYPNITFVGGTNLVTSGPGGPWISEMGWSLSGGGPNPPRYTIPDYQVFPGVITDANKGSRALRNLPDVALEAGDGVEICGTWPIGTGSPLTSREYRVLSGFCPAVIGGDGF